MAKRKSSPTEQEVPSSDKPEANVTDWVTKINPKKTTYEEMINAMGPDELLNGLIFMFFIRSAQREKLHVEFSYDPGAYVLSRDFMVEGELLLPEEISPDKIKQGPDGFEVTVDGYSFTDEETDTGIVFVKLDEVISAGVQLVADSKDMPTNPVRVII